MHFLSGFVGNNGFNRVKLADIGNSRTPHQHNYHNQANKFHCEPQHPRLKVKGRDYVKTKLIFPLVPKLYLGTKMVAKLSLVSKGVPKLELGNEKKRRPAGSPLRLTLTPVYRPLTTDY